ncbi:MAG: class I tRNA ligase family protein [Defluviitaleaceae bacterium]|nr:class I tRNA ligase family protein [Defluviitaleaceae bacterium]
MIEVKFPKRAVITGGMPYGDKALHFGHLGGPFIPADIYARFLRDRIGKDNVIYVSGTDCFGAGIEVKFQAAQADGFAGSIQDFVAGNHKLQKEMFEAYGSSMNMYAASSLEPAASRHKAMSENLFNTWYKQGYLRMEEVQLFYDEESETFLNGRQVEGKCPINGCQSEKGYADECALGHQYAPKELIDPKSVITGKTPTLRPNKNWYFDLERFSEDLKKRHSQLKERGISRRFLLSYIEDFLKDPAILISKVEQLETLYAACKKMPSHAADIKKEKKSAVLTFKALKDRETACEILREHGIRFRTGTTLTPFRLTGNVKWGIKVPEKDGIDDQTFWVWPESLWAPLSFVQTYLDLNRPGESWDDWWFGDDSQVYQFIGEDNIYFYDIAGMGLFMALNEAAGRDRLANLPVVIPSRHLFFGNSKAASSGKLRAPAADELLQYYTAEQLRMHFGHMALQNNSVKFLPKAVFKAWQAQGVDLPKDLGDIEGFDATLAEGNLLTNVFNRLARSCFYSLQQYFEGKLPSLEISEKTKQMAETLIQDFQLAMYRFEFSRAYDFIDKYLRDTNKIFDAGMKEAKENESLRPATLIDGFYAMRVAAVLLHPFAPEGTEAIAEYLNFGPAMWDWANIHKPISFFAPEGHQFKFLEPRIDFFLKHPSQIVPRE